MRSYSLLSAPLQHILTEVLFLSLIAELALCLYQRLCRSGRARRIPDGILLALLFCACAHLLAGLHSGAPTAIPWLFVPLAAVLVLLHAALSIRHEFLARRERLTPDSVKQALDNLNTGILFADADNSSVLVNKTMGELCVGLTGAYPQTLTELTEALKNAERLTGTALYRLPDGRVWQIQTVPLTEPTLVGYTQTTAQDMTELYGITEALAKENAALRSTIEKTRHMLERVAERAREQETLEIKTRVHNEIGRSLIAVTELLRGGGMPGEEFHILRQAASLFSGDGPTLPDTLEDVRRMAAELRVTLTLDGLLPRGKQTERLLADAAMECVTNCVRHAKGTWVNIRLSEHNGIYSAVITNDGQPPSGPIVEGGGLGNLRRRVEEAGGEMHVSHSPRFALILNLVKEGSKS